MDAQPPLGKAAFLGWAAHAQGRREVARAEMAPTFRATGRSRDFGVVPDLHGLEAHATSTTEFRNLGAEKYSS